MTTLLVALRNFAYSPKNRYVSKARGRGLGSLTQGRFRGGSYSELGKEFSVFVKDRALLDWSMAVQIVNVSRDGIPCSKTEGTQYPGRRIIFIF